MHSEHTTDIVQRLRQLEFAAIFLMAIWCLAVLTLEHTWATDKLMGIAGMFLILLAAVSPTYLIGPDPWKAVQNGMYLLTGYALMGGCLRSFEHDPKVGIPYASLAIVFLTGYLYGLILPPVMNYYHRQKTIRRDKDQHY